MNTFHSQEDVAKNEEKLEKVSREMLQVIVECVDEYVEKELGLEKRAIDKSDILFEHTYASPNYNSDTHKCTIPLFEIANPTVYIHELVHYVSADHRFKNSDLEKRAIRTGFDIKNKKSEGAVYPSSYFRGLNEGVTQYITKKIFTKYRNRLQDPMDEADMYVNKMQQYFHKALIKDFIDSIDTVSLRKALDLKKRRQNATMIQSQDVAHKVYIMNLLKKERSSEKKALLLKLSGDVIPTTIIGNEVTIQKQIQREYELKEADLNDYFLRHKNRIATIGIMHDAYEEQQRLFVMLLYGLALASHNEDLDDAFTQVEKQFCIEYFNGSFEWCKEVEKVFGAGTVKKLGMVSADAHYFPYDFFNQILQRIDFLKQNRALRNIEEKNG